MVQRKFSRFMPALPEAGITWTGRLTLAALAAGLGTALVVVPVVTVAVIGIIALSSAALERRRAVRIGPLLSSRKGEDIGTFALAFDRHRGPLDPWAIRAVWNAIVPLTNTRGQLIPLRPTDRFEQDLEVDPEDIEYEIPKLTAQCQRELTGYAQNPYYREIRTVEGLVRFISAQPLRSGSPRMVAP
jgi:hypothetical protein